MLLFMSPHRAGGRHRRNRRQVGLAGQRRAIANSGANTCVGGADRRGDLGVHKPSRSKPSASRQEQPPQGTGRSPLDVAPMGSNCSVASCDDRKHAFFGHVMGIDGRTGEVSAGVTPTPCKASLPTSEKPTTATTMMLADVEGATGHHRHHRPWPLSRPVTARTATRTCRRCGPRAID